MTDMSTIQHQCRQCSSAFSVTDEDRAFLEKMAPTFAGKKFAIPDPTLCPDCREQRRCVQWNEMKLYKSTCALTGKQIMSCIHPDSPYTIYDQEIWYSDKWEPMQYGRDFDFSRPFFEQYYELTLAVPHFNLFTGYQYDENCDFTNYSGKNKNCYLIFDSDENRDCLYGFSLNTCRDCVDNFRLRSSELCYECIDCQKCYDSSYLQDCSNCRNSMFLKNCIGCSNCLMCSNLQNKTYHIENNPVSKEQFDAAMLTLRSRPAIEASKKHFEEFCLQFPQKAVHGMQNENVSGDYLTQCKNASDCFDSTDLWDCKHIYRGWMPVKDSMDCEAPGEAEKLYECAVVGYNAYNLLFCSNGLDQISDELYTTFCMHCSNLFGCCGLRNKKYCIFNKQYTKEEYEVLVARIIGHMQKTGEWGEFFPVEHSPFAYNESNAFDHYPMTKEEVRARGWQWREKDPKEYAPQSYRVSDSIADVKDDVVNEVLACATCGKNYRITTKELAFYRNHGFPIPVHCFDCRHAARRNKRNPRTMFDRSCMKCGKAIRTTYGPDRPDIVYCEECYLEALS
jgi:hypothetical protein